MIRSLIIYCLLTLILASCGQDSPSDAEYVELTPAVYGSLVNNFPASAGGNQNLDKTIYSDEAKAYFSLYSDGKLYYEITRVGSGVGEWVEKDGYLELTADTGLFDMILKIKSKDNKTYEFHYRDRFGFNVVQADVKNI